MVFVVIVFLRISALVIFKSPVQCVFAYVNYFFNLRLPIGSFSMVRISNVMFLSFI